MRQEEYDRRWVPCRRPFVITGGELTLEMLDLRYDQTGHYYEAPLHMKALGGCFLIDDFGRQLVSPANLLNRWIVPLESRIDLPQAAYRQELQHSVRGDGDLLHQSGAGATDGPRFPSPPALQDRSGRPFAGTIPAHLRTGVRATRHDAVRGVFAAIVYKMKKEKGLDFAAYQPKFIVEQVVATCRFMGEQPHFEPRFIDYAMDNLRVRHHSAGN